MQAYRAGALHQEEAVSLPVQGQSAAPVRAIQVQSCGNRPGRECEPTGEAPFQDHSLSTGGTGSRSLGSMERPRHTRRVRAGVRKRGNWVQLSKFAVVGASGYVINLVVFAALVKGFGVHPVAAAVGAFCVAVLNNFLWNRAWTFSDTQGRAGFQATRFFLVSLGALLVNIVVLEILIGQFDLPELLAQALAVGVATPVNFIGNKLWTFDDRSSPAGPGTAAEEAEA